MGTELNPAEEDADLWNFCLPTLGDVCLPSTHIPPSFLLDTSSSAGVP